MILPIIQGVPKYRVQTEEGDSLAYFMTELSYKPRSANASLPIYRVLKFKYFFSFLFLAPAIFEVFSSNLAYRLRNRKVMIAHVKRWWKSTEWYFFRGHATFSPPELIRGAPLVVYKTENNFSILFKIFLPSCSFFVSLTLIEKKNKNNFL